MEIYSVYLFNGNRTLEIIAAGFEVRGEYVVFFTETGEDIACFHNATSVTKRGAANG